MTPAASVGLFMSSRLKLAVAMGFALILGACGSLPPESFEQSTRITVRHICLTPLGVPDRPQVTIMNPIGVGFGVLGTLIESRRAAGAQQEMQNALAKAGYNYEAALANSISAAMSKAGFAVTRSPGPRPEKERSRFLSRYPAIKRVDAFLDVYADYVGFQAAQSSADYRPRLEITARLVDVKDGKTLFQDRIVYGAPGSTDEDTILVQADERFRFRDRAALQVDPSTTAQALQAAIDAVAWELAKQFM
jgi:hypothetical protein